MWEPTGLGPHDAIEPRVGSIVFAGSGERIGKVAMHGVIVRILLGQLTSQFEDLVGLSCPFQVVRPLLRPALRCLQVLQLLVEDRFQTVEQL